MFHKPTYNSLLPAIYLIFILIYLLSGCSQNSDQREFERAAFSEPSGITETNERGEIINNNNDPDDWRISPFFQGDVDIIPPPFPNPVQSNDIITIEIQVYVLDRISEIYLRVYQPPNMYPVDEQRQITTGGTTFRIISKLIAPPNQPDPAGTYRLIIQDESENVITYGDIEIQ